MNAVGILFIVLSIICIAGIVYTLLDKKHFKDKEV
jgi:hypothetical protein